MKIRGKQNFNENNCLRHPPNRPDGFTNRTMHLSVIYVQALVLAVLPIILGVLIMDERERVLSASLFNIT